MTASVGDRGRSQLVSVVVPVLNEAEHVGTCLDALFRQTYPQDLMEIVVAEGASSDGTRGILDGIAASNPQLRIVDNPSGRTPDALNAALRASRGEVIARMDAHAIPAADYVERCISVLAASSAWCVGGRMIKSGGGKVAEAIAAASSSPFGVGDSAFHYLSRPADVESVYLGCWPRAVFEHIGMFDPELARNQDDEFSFRLREAGGTIRFDPSIAVTYVGRPTLRAVFRQYYQYGYWKIRVFQKHGRALRWRHLVPPLFVALVAIGIAVGALTRNGSVLLVGALTAVAYGLVAAAVAWRLSKRGVQMRHVVAAFAAMHTGYGLGIWGGLARFGPRWLWRDSSSSVPRLGSHERDEITRGNGLGG